MRRMFGLCMALLMAVMLCSCGGNDFSPDAALLANASPPKRVAAGNTGFVPQPGWWWNVTEQGSGFAIEFQGSSIFMASFLYEATGEATWNVSTMVQQIDGSYVGDMTRYAGGQTLLGAFHSAAPTATVATATLRFGSSTTGTLTVHFGDGGADRVIVIERFPISTPVAFAVPNSNFQSGWWWNPAEGGRGYYVEVQGSNAFVGSFMYDVNGNPTWYVSYANLVDASTVNGRLLQYRGGQSLNGSYRSPQQQPDNIGAINFRFTSPTTATMTLPNGATVPLSRFAFNGSSIDLFGLSGDGNGLWTGNGGGDAGSADGSGAAGDGEYVKATIKFPYISAPTGTVTWTVVRSQYGLTNTTGTLTIQKDLSGKGGYKVTGVNGGGPSSVSATQGNFYVALNGQVSGTLPLLINGVKKDSLYTFAQSVKGTAAANDFSEYAGTYGFGYTSVDTGWGTNPWVSSGVFKFNANGKGRICDESLVYSDTCTNGLDVVATYYDANTHNVLRFREASVQSAPIAAGWATAVDVIAVMHKFGSNGVSFIGDFVSTGVGAYRSGAQFGSRASASPLSPSSAIGAWDASLDILGLGSYITQFAVADVGGTIKSRNGIASNNCGYAPATLTSLPTMNGALLSRTPGQSDANIIFLDDDVVAYTIPGDTIGFARRYSSRPTAAPCQPY